MKNKRTYPGGGKGDTVGKVSDMWKSTEIRDMDSLLRKLKSWVAGQRRGNVRVESGRVRFEAGVVMSDHEVLSMSHSKTSSKPWKCTV